MKLTLKERIELLLNFPTKGTPVKLMILDEIKSMIVISAEEREKFELKENTSDDGRYSITWNNNGLDDSKEIEFSKDQVSTLKDMLDGLGDQFPVSLLELYKKLQ